MRTVFHGCGHYYMIGRLIFDHETNIVEGWSYMQEDIVERLDKALVPSNAYDEHTRTLLIDAQAEIVRVRRELTEMAWQRSVAGAVSAGPSLNDLRTKSEEGLA